MEFCRKLLFLVLLLLATSVSFAQWKIATPRQVLPVPSDGSTVNFPNVNLISGMKYRVHASGLVTVSNKGETADACYYISAFFLYFPPTTVPVSLKFRNGAASENWFYNFNLQGSYQSNHNYDATITSLGSPLSFRFFDTQDPPSNYYSDNSGSLLIDAARETPGIAIWRDTIDFGQVRVGIPKTLPDSIESYGVEPLNVDRGIIVGDPLKKFSVVSENTLPHPFSETTNEFRFTYSPTNTGRDSAEFHIYSTNAFGADQERIIYLYGSGISTNLSFRTDTLDFGAIRTGSSKTLPDSVINPGNASFNVLTITPENAASAFAAAGTPFTALAAGRTGFTVKFSPPANGNYFEKFDVTTDDGSVFHFYAKGIGGVPVVLLEKNVLDFGKVILGASKILSTKFGNTGAVPFSIVSSNLINGAEYSLVRPLATTYDGGVVDSICIKFTPASHIPACGDHPGSLTLNYDDGTSSTIIFKGCDHLPIKIGLEIDTLYYVNAGEDIDVTEKLVEPGDPLDSTADPVKVLNEELSYNANLFDLLSIDKGSLISGNEWDLKWKKLLQPGDIAYTISSATARLGPAGTLLKFRFHAHSDDTVGAYSDLIQSFISFDTPLEPQAAYSPGKITISDICTPVRLTTGNAATGTEQNTPNPVTSITHIRFAVGKNVDQGVNVRISLYDPLGRLAKVLLDEPKTSGMYDLIFDGSAYSSGTYTYVFQAGDHVESRTMIIAR